jgi:hypothetical protein
MIEKSRFNGFLSEVKAGETAELLQMLLNVLKRDANEIWGQLENGPLVRSSL